MTAPFELVINYKDYSCPAMTTALSSALTSADTAQAPILPGSAEAKPADARSAATDFLQIESIVLNLDASLRVHARAHFFSWTQGLLQSLIRHELLICTLCLGKPPAFRADGFSMTTPEPTLFSDMFLRDTAVAPTLLKAWEERRYQPVVIDVSAANPIGGGGFVRELEKLGATQLLVHGIHDAEGRATSLFAFACRPGSVTPRQAYLAQLLAPSLHAAWVRTQLAKRAEASGEKSPGGSVLTVRELDILKWIYLGKSN